LIHKRQAVRVDRHLETGQAEVQRENSLMERLILMRLEQRVARSRRLTVLINLV
jgi:hypothetical protein